MKNINKINKNILLDFFQNPIRSTRPTKLQFTHPRRNFSPPLATEKKNKGIGEGKEKGLSTSASVLLLKDTFNQLKLMRQHRDPRLKRKTET
ncbi:hypothetical protein Avbf_00100 [Armadillidium vulgare]|nr:hypothetical protein Avbf_00100 [Armadillidium vulgare]